MSTDAAIPAWPDGYAQVILDTVDSTNAEALRRGPDLPIPTWILARRQTAARGRRGRPWSTPAGNFAASLALRPDCPPEQAAHRSFVAALALWDALTGATGAEAPFALKWPNDVLLNGGKVAGILLESSGAGAAMQLAIGIGVNLAAAPGSDQVEPGAVPPVSLREDIGVSVTPEAFLAHLAAGFAARETQLRSFGFAALRTAWLARAARLGQTIRVRSGREEFSGRFEGLDEAGALLLGVAEGIRRVPAADVFF